MTQYKLVILKTARQVPGLWRHLDLAFHKKVALPGVADWSRMNIDLYNYHTRVLLQPQHPPSDPSVHLLPLME